jgi:hypothetical protein
MLRKKDGASPEGSITTLGSSIEWRINWVEFRCILSLPVHDDCFSLNHRAVRGTRIEERRRYG